MGCTGAPPFITAIVVTIDSPILITLKIGTAPPTNAQLLIIVHIGFNNSRLNHHLPNRDIELRDNAPQLIQLLLGLVSNNTVGTIIYGDRTTFLFRVIITYASNGLEQSSNVSCFSIIYLN